MPDAAEKTFELGAVILAAGRSSRMGQPKMLLPWANTSVIGHLLETWLRLPVRQVAVVCAANDTLLQCELDRVLFPAANRIFNPAPERGMFHSIQCASAWSGWQPQLTHWVIALGDQPHLKPETLTKLLQSASERHAPVCQPVFRSRPRHPVVLSRGLFLEIARSQCGNLKEFLAAHSPALCDLDDPGLASDMDRPEDYEQLKQRLC